MWRPGLLYLVCDGGSDTTIFVSFNLSSSSAQRWEARASHTLQIFYSQGVIDALIYLLSRELVQLIKKLRQRRTWWSGIRNKITEVSPAKGLEKSNLPVITKDLRAGFGLGDICDARDAYIVLRMRRNEYKGILTTGCLLGWEFKRFPKRWKNSIN